jgi:DNA-binding NtrC family response regulator
MISQNILIVDDDTVFRASLKVFLENHNYKVCETGSVKKAIKHDVILCDGKTIGPDLLAIEPAQKRKLPLL